MQRRELFQAGRVNIAKGQHVLEPIFTPTFVPALSLERLRILEGAKEHVPERNVREVVGVMPELMMDAVRFGPLENETNPQRCFDIPMVKEFPHCDKDGVIAGSGDAGPKERIHNQTAQNGVNQNLHRMFVKACNDFKATGRMVDLM